MNVALAQGDFVVIGRVNICLPNSQRDLRVRKYPPLQAYIQPHSPPRVMEYQEKVFPLFVYSIPHGENRSALSKAIAANSEGELVEWFPSSWKFEPVCELDYSHLVEVT